MTMKTKIFSFFVLLTFTGAAPPIIYPFTSTCAVRGSKVTLPCSFTPLKSIDEGGRRIQLQVVRVVWCRNHEMCQGGNPSVYDSKAPHKPGLESYQYVGDMKSNCTLQINDVQRHHEGTFRFRMEVNFTKGHFTNMTGVKLEVTDGTRMKINSSETKLTFSRGDSLTLHCNALCSFHQLMVTWSRNGHALQESGPSLQLTNLNPVHSGNYTCALTTNSQTESLPYRLEVEEEEGDAEGQNVKPCLISAVVLALVLIILTLIFFFFI